METCLSQASPTNVVVRECQESEPYLGQGVVFIFDEFYDCLIDSSLDVDRLGQTNPVFLIGETEDLLIVTGHYSRNFMAFLNTRFDKPVKLYSCKDYVWLEHEANRQVNCKVVCLQKRDMLMSVKQKIEKKAKK